MTDNSHQVKVKSSNEALTDLIKHETLTKYLEYVDNTESPTLFHVWSIITAVAATCGRHTWLETGLGKIYPNIYTLLVGPPGVRKSTAINCTKKLFTEVSGIRLAPKDTSGKHQGLISAMTRKHAKKKERERPLTPEEIEAVIDNMHKTKSITQILDEHVLYVCASEFGSFMGQGNLELTRFLAEMWDGEDYPYSLRNSELVLTDPLLTILGGTTVTDLSSILPSEAMGQGFMSRCILVYQGKKAKSVPPSKVCLVEGLAQDMRQLFVNAEIRRGKIYMSHEADILSDHIYLQKHSIEDARFFHYLERRHSHLMKVATTLAIMRNAEMIDAKDIEQAHDLLKFTEFFMPEALGEYGLSPVSVSRQKLIDFLRNANEPLDQGIVWTMMRKDMRESAFQDCLTELIRDGTIEIYQKNSDSPPKLIYIERDISIFSHLESEFSSDMDDLQDYDLTGLD